MTRQRGLLPALTLRLTAFRIRGTHWPILVRIISPAVRAGFRLLAESKVGSAKLTGYWEADFLGTGVTSNNRQSNSYVFRQRVLYGQAAFDSGWIITGGQQWSLATETKKGITNRTEVLPQTIDSQYQVGFNWARQYGFRVVKDFGGKFALGLPVEAPEATIGGRGFSSVATTTSAKPRLPRQEMPSSLLRVTVGDYSTSSTRPDIPSTNRLTLSLRPQPIPVGVIMKSLGSSVHSAIEFIPAVWWARIRKIRSPRQPL